MHPPGRDLHPKGVLGATPKANGFLRQPFRHLTPAHPGKPWQNPMPIMTKCARLGTSLLMFSTAFRRAQNHDLDDFTTLLKVSTFQKALIFR